MFDFLQDPKKEQKSEKAFSIKQGLNSFVKKNPESEPRTYNSLPCSGIYNIGVDTFVKGYFIPSSEVLDIDDMLTFKVGHAIHGVIQGVLIRSGIMVEGSCEQKYLCRTYGFSGKIDGIVDASKLFPKKYKEYYPMHLEIKSCAEFAFKNINFSSDISDSYKCQAEIYQKLLGVKETLFVFVNKGSYSFKSIIYPWSGEYYNLMVEKAKKIWEFIGKRELPSYDEISKEQWTKMIEGINRPLSPAEIYAKEETVIV